MNLTDFLSNSNGGWNGNSAFVVIEDYRWKVAYKENGETKLTPDGVRLGAVIDVAYTSADVVVSEPKQRKRKPKVAYVPEDLDEPNDLDDLDL